MSFKVPIEMIFFESNEFVTGKYANLRICNKILLKKTQPLENPSSSYLFDHDLYENS